MANLRSKGAIPDDLIATMTNLPRLRSQLRDLSQDVAIGIPDAVQEALDKAVEALELAEQTVVQAFLTASPSPALPSSRALTVGTGMSVLDGGAGAAFQILLAAFLASLSQLTGNGMVAKTASGAQLRAIEAGSSRVEVLNGDGTTGNPAIDIDEPSLDVGNMGGTLGIAHGGTGVTVLSAFSAHNNGVNQSIPTTTWQQVNVSVEDFDLNSDFSAGAWTPPAGRPIHLVGNVRVTMTSAGTVYVAIYKNGAVYRRGNNQSVDAAANVQVSVSCIDIPSGTDVYSLRVYQDSGVAQSTFGAIEGTYFQGSML